MAALFHSARIFKEPMISRNLFDKPVKCIGTTIAAFHRPTVHRDNRTHCPNVHFHSFSRKDFVAAKLFRIGEAVCISSRGVHVFPALSPGHVRPSYGNFFLMVFQGNCVGCTGHMITYLPNLAW